MAKCEFCGKQHDGSYGTGRFCSKACRDYWSGQKTKESFKNNFVYVPKLETRICPKCGKQFTVDVKKERGRKHSKTYCSRSCANSRIMTSNVKQKISKGIDKYYTDNNIQRLDKSIYKNGLRHAVCVICGKSFEYYHKGKPKTCNNPQCRSLYLSKQIKKSGTGGHRLNSGNGKSGWYKGISCQSTYELAWVIYNLDHNIKFQRCKKVFQYEVDGQIHKYYPDFELQDGTIIEIKGYYQNTVKLKQQAVLQQGYNYKILYKKDLKVCFDYIKENYNVTKENLIMLYDENKGYIEKNCIICGKQFKTRNANQITCSRSCNGKYVQGKRKLI